MFRKALITLAAGLVIWGAFTIYCAASGISPISALKRYNIFDLVDENVKTMEELNSTMDHIQENATLLNSKLDVLERTNQLLKDQASATERINDSLAREVPMLETSNANISTLQAELAETLKIAQALKPTIGWLTRLTSFSANLTGDVVGGAEQMASSAQTISYLFDRSLALLYRIQPNSAKAKRLMQGGALALVPQFMNSGSKASSASARNGSGNEAGALVEKIAKQVLAPVDQALNGLPVVGDTVDELKDLVDKLLPLR